MRLILNVLLSLSFFTLIPLEAIGSKQKYLYESMRRPTVRQNCAIGLCITATGKYINFVKPLIESARKYFCKNHRVTFFVFTDGNLEQAPDIVKIYQNKIGWPYDTLKRFQFYDAARNALEKMDYIFATDADMLFVDCVGDEILGNLVATQHPGFLGVRGTYETDSRSTAYVKKSEGKQYFAGGFYGGDTQQFLELVGTCKECINKDLEKNYIAIWHDESHLNRYFINHRPSLILSPSYCYPESWKLPFSKKLIALDKNHQEIRRSARIINEEESPIVIVIPSYNNQNWYDKNLASIFFQNYHNYRIIYIDDCSQDNTGALVEEFVQKVHQGLRFTLIKNEKRRGALANLYDAIHSCDDDEIIITVDGDDWLFHDNVLHQVNQAYVRGDVWLTHGKFTEFPVSGFWSEPVPEDYVKRNAFREYKCASHLRTFKAWLFKRIKLEDLLDETGNFFQMTWDQAMMFPMLEMAGERHKYISEVNYVYNCANSLNDNKVNAQLQRDLEKVMRNKPRYQRLVSTREQ